VFPDEAQEEVFDGGDPRISGVFSPTGTAVPMDGGFVVNGRWPFNTGCDGARWTIVNAVLGHGPGAGMPMCVLTKSRDLKIHDDWHASGMSATGSKTIVAENVFVPSHGVQSLVDMLQAKYPPRHNAANRYFQYPLAPVLSVNAGGTPVGIARGALEAFHERLPGRGITYTNYANKIDAAVTHLQVGEAVLKIDSADAHVRLATAMLDAYPYDMLTAKARVKSRAHIAYATGLAREAVDLLFYSSGASAIQSQVPIQRFQRDIQALSNHAIMHPQTIYELYGRVLLGLEPNTPIY
jgi:alkylation response protein AidB-like acyl-CoA dehydrogenase